MQGFFLKGPWNKHDWDKSQYCHWNLPGPLLDRPHHVEKQWKTSLYWTIVPNFWTRSRVREPILWFRINQIFQKNWQGCILLMISNQSPSLGVWYLHFVPTFLCSAAQEDRWFCQYHYGLRGIDQNVREAPHPGGERWKELGMKFSTWLLHLCFWRRFWT